MKTNMENENSRIIDINHAEHYKWGNGCDGWHFVKTDSLSVIKETMPRMTKERLHYHEKAQQFFFILTGVATFEIDGLTCNVNRNQGITIKPGVRHCILNNGDSDLEFIVISEPKSHGDRVNVDDEK